MVVTSKPQVHTPAVEDDGTGYHIAEAAASWQRHLRYEQKSESTVTAYLGAVHMLDEYLSERGMPRDVAHIRREHVESFIVWLLTPPPEGHGYKASSAGNRHRALKVFFQWCVEEGEISRSPMERLREPRPAEVVVPILTEAQMARLLKVTAGRDYEARRDHAILSLFMDTGSRLSEIANLQVADVDLDNLCIHVTGKGNRPRIVPFGHATAKALDRYLRERAKVPGAARRYSALWLGGGGGHRDRSMTPNGIGQVVRRRGAEAGIEGLHPHQFRHTFAHRWLSQGGQETDLMRVTGWKSRSMLERYGTCGASDGTVLRRRLRTVRRDRDHHRPDWSAHHHRLRADVRDHASEAHVTTPHRSPR